MSQHSWVLSACFWAVGLIVACASPPVRAQDEPAAAAGGFDQTDWQHVLSTYASSSGRFDYAALGANDADKALLHGYLERVAEADPSGWSDNDRLAFWVNAYNALVVQAVLDHSPLGSVLDVEGFFDQVRYRAGGQEQTLNDIENNQIREPFHQPLIHFAVNCGAVSCPPIRPEAYGAEHIVDQMDEQARAFVNASTRVEGDGVHLSKIFEWFGDDFAVVGGVRAFVAERLSDADGAAAVRDEAHPLAHDEYDWHLNQP